MYANPIGSPFTTRFYPHKFQAQLDQNLTVHTSILTKSPSPHTKMQPHNMTEPLPCLTNRHSLLDRSFKFAFITPAATDLCVAWIIWHTSAFCTVLAIFLCNIYTTIHPRCQWSSFCEYNYSVIFVLYCVTKFSKHIY